MALKPNTPVPLWRCIVYNVAIAGWTVIIGGALFPGAIFSKRIADKVTPPWTAGALWLAKHICGQEYEFRGEENIMYQHMIIASKHQSAFEIIVLLNQFPRARFVIKRELIWVPVFGWYLWRIGMVPIKRHKSGKLMDAVIEGSRRILHQRRPLIIFPEGTRTEAGQIGKHQPGAALVYDHFKLPIMPVAVNTGYYWPKKRTVKMAGTSVIEFLPTIQPGLSFRQCLKQLKNSVEDASQALYEEAVEKTNQAQQPNHSDSPEKEAA